MLPVLSKSSANEYASCFSSCSGADVRRKSSVPASLPPHAIAPVADRHHEAHGGPRFRLVQSLRHQFQRRQHQRYDQQLRRREASFPLTRQHFPPLGERGSSPPLQLPAHTPQRRHPRLSYSRQYRPHEFCRRIVVGDLRLRGLPERRGSCCSCCGDGRRFHAPPGRHGVEPVWRQ